MEKRAFSEYFTSYITEEMLRDPGKDVTTIKVDLELSTLKPRHGKLMKELYEWLLSEKGKSIILSGCPPELRAQLEKREVAGCPLWIHIFRDL